MIGFLTHVYDTGGGWGLFLISLAIIGVFTTAFRAIGTRYNHPYDDNEED